MSHDKWVNETDTSDQAGVKGGKRIALHIRTLMETGVQAASSCTCGQLHRQILLIDLCQSFACITFSSSASLLFLLLSCYVAEKKRKKNKKKRKKKKREKAAQNTPIAAQSPDRYLLGPVRSFELYLPSVMDL